MDPYIPHLSSPVYVDSSAIRKHRLTKFVQWVLAVVLMSFFLVAASIAYAEGEASDDRGEVIIYRVIHSRPAIRQSAPETPVAVHTGSVASYSSQVADSDLAAISALGAHGTDSPANSNQGVRDNGLSHLYRGASDISAMQGSGLGTSISSALTSSLGGVGMRVSNSVTGTLHSSFPRVPAVTPPNVR